MPAIAFDRFHRYAELTELLHAFVREHPQLVSIESIGRSHEGRDIFVLTVTNAATGPASDKPAMWVDGNIHATEVAASAANLYFLDTLVRGHGIDPEITRALDTRAFYVCPRMNPDGAEWALADQPKWVRSSTRPYPFDEDAIEGLTVEDIDGDGLILQMRLPDPNGLWKEHPDAPGLMIRREPTETGGALLPDPARGHARPLRRLHAEAEAAEAGPRPQPQLPGELAAGVRAAGGGTVPDVGARGARRRRLHRPSHQSHLRHDVPHLERRAAAAVRAPGRRRDARRGPVVLPPCRR